MMLLRFWNFISDSSFPLQFWYRSVFHHFQIAVFFFWILMANQLESLNQSGVTTVKLFRRWTAPNAPPPDHHRATTSPYCISSHATSTLFEPLLLPLSLTPFLSFSLS